MSEFAPKESLSSKRTNIAVNRSLGASLYSRLSAYIQSLYSWPENFLEKLDNIYFVILAILIFAIPFVQTGILGALASLLIIISVVSSVLSHKRFNVSTIHIPVIVYLAILAISAGFSALFIPSLKGLAKMVIYIGAYFSFFEFLKKDPKRIISVVALVALSASLELLFSLKQMIFGVDELASWQDKTFLNPENTMNRVFGTLKPLNPNLFAGYLLAVVPCIFSGALISLCRNSKTAASIFGLFGLLGLVTIVQTGSRGAYIGLFLGFVFLVGVFLGQLKKMKISEKINPKILAYIILGFAAIGIIAALASPSISHRLASIFTFRGDSSNSYRMNVYISSWKMFMDNFWIGIGTGNTTYRLIYGLYMVTGFDALGAYNIYLEMAVESGIFAVLTFLWLIVLTLKKGIRQVASLAAEYKIVIILCMTAIFAMLSHGIVDTVWYRPQLQLIFWLYVAIIAALTMRGFSHEK